MSGEILVAGIGNLFLSDDGFGCEVARRLAGIALPAGVRVRDYGIRGLDLAYALSDGLAAAILVDALPRGAAPGTLFVLEPEVPPGELPAGGPAALLSGHGLDPATVLRLARVLGPATARVRLVGCEPLLLEEGMALSEPVERAVEGAVALVLEQIAELGSTRASR